MCRRWCIIKTENIEVTFEIQCACNRPNLNRTVYTEEVIEKAYRNVNNVQIGIYNEIDDFTQVGVAQDVEFIDKMELCSPEGLELFSTENRKVDIKYMTFEEEIIKKVILEKLSNDELWELAGKDIKMENIKKICERNIFKFRTYLEI